MIREAAPAVLVLHGRVRHSPGQYIVELFLNEGLRGVTSWRKQRVIPSPLPSLNSVLLQSRGAAWTGRDDKVSYCGLSVIVVINRQVICTIKLKFNLL